MDKQKVIVTGVKRYKFEDRETGEILQGANVFYTTTEHETDNDLLGSVMNKANLPYETFDSFRNWNFPSIAEMEVSLSFSGRNPRIQVKGFRHIQDISLGEKVK